MGNEPRKVEKEGGQQGREQHGQQHHREQEQGNHPREERKQPVHETGKGGEKERKSGQGGK